MSTGAIIGIVVGGIVLLLIIWFVVSYNGFIKLKNKIDEAYSTMDVCMKKRYDLIPNLVSTVKGYAAHEQQTLQNVVAARNAAASATAPEQKIAGENALTGTLRQLFAIAENYPDLKANTNFLDLQNQLQAIETEIANSRRYYNAVVNQFNTKRESFPSNILAGMFHFTKRPLFEVDSAQERQNVQVTF